MNVQALSALKNGEILVGKVARGYSAREQLLGAVLSFEGRSETALLHVKQIASDDPAERLSNLKIGEEVRVKITIATEGGVRKLRASEKDLASDQDVVDALNAASDDTVYAARVVNVATYGIFINIEEGPGKGKKGLVHNKNIYNGSSMSLKAFGELVPNKKVTVRLLDEAKLDDAGTLRINLAFAPEPEAAITT